MPHKHNCYRPKPITKIIILIEVTSFELADQNERNDFQFTIIYLIFRKGHAIPYNSCRRISWYNDLLTYYIVCTEEKKLSDKAVY